MKRNVYHFIIALGAVFLLAACSSTPPPPADSPVRVQTLRMGQGTSHSSYSYAGTVTAPYTSSLSFATVGTVSQVLVQAGTRVQARQILATLDKTVAQNAYTMAQASLQQAQDAHQRLERLHTKGSLPDIQWIEVQTKLTQAQAAVNTAQKALEDCVLRAPYSGYIAHRSVEIGNNVVPGMQAFELVKTDHLEVSISVPEGEISSLRVGQSAQISIAAAGVSQTSAQIISKGVIAGTLSRTYPVRLSFTSKVSRILPGMVCDVQLSPSSPKGSDSTTLILPQEAIMLHADNTHYVWVIRSDRAQIQPIEVGEITASGLRITQGLQSGDEVVTQGMDKLSSGIKITRV